MLATFLACTAAALLAPRIVPGVQVAGIGSAGAVAVFFGVANLLSGWVVQAFLTIVTLPAIVLSLGIFMLAIPTISNAILLRVVTVFVPGFRVEGWIPALGMGFLFALAGWAAERFTS